MAITLTSALPERLTAYRPVVDRLIFGLALVGILVVVHLGIQQNRGFDRGCFGFSAPASVEATFDCTAVVQSGAGTLLGVSNVVWGFGFYLAVAALTFAALQTAPSLRKRLKAGRAGLVTAGLLYSGYLVYLQFYAIGALCALCLTSAGVAAALFAVQAAALFIPLRMTDSSMSMRNAKRELALMTYLAAFAVVVAGADVTYFSTLDEASAAPPAQAAAGPQQEAAATGTTAVPDTSESGVPDDCSFDPEKTPVENYESLVDFQDPVMGNPDAPVTVIEYFDPNCPHCKTAHAVMKEVIDQYGDQAQFVFKPMPLWGYSVPQIEALYAAAQEDKFFEMLDEQFERQQRGGLSTNQLRTIAREIGMNPDVLVTRIEQNTYRDLVLQQRQKAVDIGVDSTPTILVNGRFVDTRSARCLGAFIEAAHEKATSTSAGG